MQFLQWKNLQSIEKFQKEFFEINRKNWRSISLFTVQFMEKFAINREISKEFFAIDRENSLYRKCTVNKPIHCKKFLWKISRSITNFSKNCTVNKPINRKKFLWIFVINQFILCTISFKLVIDPKNFKGIFAIDHCILYTISGDLRSIGPNFQRNCAIGLT